MSLPESLRISVSPLELELIACNELIHIVPLITMGQTAFISVRTQQTRHQLHTYPTRT